MSAEAELRIALERVVSSLETSGQWRVANALNIAKAALSRAGKNSAKTVENDAGFTERENELRSALSMALPCIDPAYPGAIAAIREALGGEVSA